MLRLLCTLILAMATAIVSAGQALPPANAQPRPGPETAVSGDQPFSLAVADALLSGLRDGLVSQNAKRALQGFAREQVPGFQRLADDFDTLFANYDSVRMRYHIVQAVTEADGQRGTAMVNLTLEATPRSLEPAQRHSGQVRLEFARSGKQWKIVNVQPRSLFASF